jgi:hypothetical protein
MARAKVSSQQKTRQRNGEDSERMVELAFQRRGDRLVEKVEVPFRINRATGTQYAKRKVSGDFRAVRPYQIRTGPAIEAVINVGASVLVEVKHHEERLSWSAFRPHQIVALDEHMTAGGITEVAWIDRGDLRFIPWIRFREIGFGPERSVSWDGKTINLHIPCRPKKKA